MDLYLTNWDIDKKKNFPNIAVESNNFFLTQPNTRQYMQKLTCSSF